MLGLATSKKINWLSPKDVSVSICQSYMGEKRQNLRSKVDGYLKSSFIDRCIDIVNKSALCSSQKLMAIQMFNASLHNYCVAIDLSDENIVIHDELLMHRGFSILTHSNNFENDVSWYYRNAPLPSSVIVFDLSSDELFNRVKGREFSVNTYRFIGDKALLDLLKKNSEMYTIAKDILEERGVSVNCINASGNISNVVSNLSISFDKIVQKNRLQG